MNYKLFSSESVSNGHPDKIADQIADSILDEIIALDPDARVACEVLVKNSIVFVSGEITTDAWVDIERVVKDVIADIGYNDPELGFDSKSCSVISTIGKQSPDIWVGVEQRSDKEMGAGDQGMMFGFACDETESLMPFALFYAHKMMERHAIIRKENIIPWIRPDAKTQLTVRYDDQRRPIGIDTVVFSTQHAPGIKHKQIEEGVIEEIIKQTLPIGLISNETKFLINPTGLFVIGGPVADCGLTGRKIIVDTYGGAARHGGGAFSGKDPTKVDRSAAYMTRNVAKNIVAAGLASRCELQVAYAIGVASPISLNIDCFGTNKIPENEILKLVTDNFDFRPSTIINYLDLKKPIYKRTCNYGHFGRKGFSWEDKIDILKSKI
jgi:S-adenosylmethionine synthetase